MINVISHQCFFGGIDGTFDGLKLLGNFDARTQPIEMRFNELIGGVRSDVAVKLYGDDLDQLAVTAQRIATVLRKTPGASDVRVAQTSGFPTFDIAFNRAAIAQYGLSVKEVADTVATALAGRSAGQVFEGDRRFDIIVRLPGKDRNDLDILGAIPVMLPAVEGKARASVPLRQLVEFRFTQGLNEVSRDNGKRRIYIEANIVGRDLGSYVDDAQAAIAQEIKLPSGSWIEWGGQFQNLQAATKRLALIVPACFILIAAVLYMAIGNALLTAAVMTAVPLALAGGVFALLARNIPFSISASVGFIAVSGVAVLNGLVLIAAIKKRLAVRLMGLSQLSTLVKQPLFAIAQQNYTTYNFGHRLVMLLPMSTTLPSDSRRSRKRQQTSDHLVEVAFELFSSHGYAQVTMEQIAATADVAKGTLYNHFPVKEAILAYRFHSELGESMRSLGAEHEALPGCIARLRSFLHGLAASTERYREYMGPYLHYRLSQPASAHDQTGRNSIDLIYAKLIAEGQTSGEVRTDLPFEQLIAALGFMHLSTILRWLHTPEASLAAEFDAMLELFLNGARAGRTAA